MNLEDPPKVLGRMRDFCVSGDYIYTKVPLQT
jgi:hypothetical protein